MNTLLLIGVVLAVFGLLLPLAVRRVYRVPKAGKASSPTAFGLTGREVFLETENGKRIFAWYLPPPGERCPAPALAVMHGWGGASAQMLPLAPFFHSAGLALLFLDARNHGRSDSDTFSSMPHFAEDLGHGVDWLKAQPEVEADQVFALGHSVGAAAALLLASRRDDLSPG